MLELWLIRHGQTDWNAERRVQGWTDIPLNRAGLKEAHLLGQYLHGVPVQAIYTSDLQRANATAEVLGAHTGSVVTVDSRLRERRFGALEGHVRHSRQFAPHKGHHVDRRVISDITPYPEAGRDDPLAETDMELNRRISSFLQDIEKHHRRGRVLLVTHGGLVRALLQMLGYSEHVTLHNTSVTRIRYQSGQWYILAVGGTDHLQTRQDA